MDYAICEIKGRQYLVRPGQKIRVNKLSEEKNLTVDKVLLLVNGTDIKIGKPYLQDKLDFDVLNQVRSDKIRVVKYQPKANYRRTKGARTEYTEIRLSESKVKSESRQIKEKKGVKSKEL